MKKQLVRLTSLAIIVFFAAAGFQSSAKAAANSVKNKRILKVQNRLPDEYIVVFNEDVSENRLEETANEIARRYGGEIKYYYKYAFKGFAVTMREAAANKLARHPQVKFVQEDAVVYASGTIAQTPTPNWGLDRIDQFSLPLNNTYYYSSDGTGVHIFIVDTGINFSHVDFIGNNGISRVDLTNSANFAAQADPTFPVKDCNGHGTGVAAVAAGRTYGVAKNATLHAVRIGTCAGVSAITLKAQGLDYVASRVQQNSALRPAIVNYSWNNLATADPGKLIEAAVNRLLTLGITVVNSAGNDNLNMDILENENTPTNISGVIVVGATDTTDTRASWTFPPSTTVYRSNYGSDVDLFAPGLNVKTASWESSTATAFRFGTSFAAPHVAGAAALYLQTNPSASPAQVQSYIVSRATPNKVLNVPAGTTKSMLYTGPSLITSP